MVIGKNPNKWLKINLWKIYTYVDEIHRDILEKSFCIFTELLNDNKFANLKKDIYFTGWTSLMFKYWKKFNRFSKDLDFSVDIGINHETLITNELFSTFKTRIESMMREDSIQIFETEWDWQTIFFLWEKWDKREFKIDFMYDTILWQEEISVGNLLIKKVSDLDIVCNKLQRLSDVDVFDLDFLLRRNFDRKEEYINEIYEWLKKKSLKKYGSELTIYTKHKVFWEKQTHNLSYLKDIISKFEQDYA